MPVNNNFENSSTPPSRVSSTPQPHSRHKCSMYACVYVSEMGASGSTYLYAPILCYLEFCAAFCFHLDRAIHVGGTSLPVLPSEGEKEGEVLGKGGVPS